jgi:hypothetical protein
MDRRGSWLPVGELSDVVPVLGRREDDQWGLHTQGNSALRSASEHRQQMHLWCKAKVNLRATRHHDWCHSADDSCSKSRSDGNEPSQQSTFDYLLRVSLGCVRVDGRGGSVSRRLSKLCSLAALLAHGCQDTSTQSSMTLSRNSADQLVGMVYVERTRGIPSIDFELDADTIVPLEGADVTVTSECDVPHHLRTGPDGLFVVTFRDGCSPNSAELMANHPQHAGLILTINRPAASDHLAQWRVFVGLPPTPPEEMCPVPPRK